MDGTSKVAWITVSTGACVSLLVSFVGFWAAVIVGLIAFSGALVVAESQNSAAHVVAESQNSAAHDADVRDSRVQAYAEYFSTTSEFNEFIHANLYWSALEKGSANREVGEAAYWAEASDLQTRLEANYWATKIVAGDTTTDPLLDDIRLQQSLLILSFKCMSAIQVENCSEEGSTAVIGESSHQAILKLVSDWTKKSGPQVTKLMAEARAQTL